MSAAAQKDLICRFVDEFWSDGNLATADELMAPDVVIHTPPVGSVAELKSFVVALRAVFPDWRSTVEEMIVEEDRVAERWTGRGTYQGSFQGVAPTGNRVEVPGVVFYRIAGGKIVEFRGSFDMLSMLHQLGAIPPTALGGAS